MSHVAPPASSAKERDGPKFQVPAGANISRQSSTQPEESTRVRKGERRQVLPRKSPRAKEFVSNIAVPRSTRKSQPARELLSSSDAKASSPPATQVTVPVETSASLLGLENEENVLSVANKLNVAFRKPVEAAGHALSAEDASLISLSNTLGDSSTEDRSQNTSSFTKASSVSSGLSTPPDSPSKARCPLCKVLVDRTLLENVGGGKRMTVRQQAEFCKAHRIKSAYDEWRQRQYPEIKWSVFDQRLTGFHSQIEELLQGNAPSFYRNAYEDTVRKGKTRTLKQAMLRGETMDGMSPGYYGSKGAKMMIDNIIARFATKLRRLGSSDKLISTSGVSTYVQAVLAPELAVMLVMEDMKTDEDGAREILRDSVDIGNLLNEEEEELIYQPPERVDEQVDLVEVD